MKPVTARLGFTLIELMISVVITAIVAASILRVVMVDARFTEDREAWRTARQAARSGLTMLWSDLRMVETGAGVEAASGNGLDLTVRVPYAFAVVCTTDGSNSTVALLPVDSAMYAQGGHSGFAWRDDSTEQYTYVNGGTVSNSGTTGSCATAGITVITGARIVTLAGTVPSSLRAGTVVFLYRRVRYELKASTAMPGQLGLWRSLLTTGASEEIAAPFSAAARFRYHVGTGGTAQSTVPSPLSSIAGLELAFAGQSDRVPRWATGPKVVDLTTSVYFQNQTP